MAMCKECYSALNCFDSQPCDIQILMSHRDHWTAHHVASAAEDGCLDGVQFLVKNGCPYDESACNEAATEGHLACLQWLRGVNCAWSEETCAMAAGGGHILCLAWARLNGCPWDHTTTMEAARGGHLDCLQWAYAMGCPWETRFCDVPDQAAKHGHLHCLKWLYENGCCFNHYSPESAAYGGHVDCLRYIFERCGLMLNDWMPQDLINSSNMDIHAQDLQWVIDRVRQHPNFSGSKIPGGWTKLQQKLDEHNINKREMAARCIQGAWIRCWYDPDMQMCQRRVQGLNQKWGIGRT